MQDIHESLVKLGHLAFVKNKINRTRRSLYRKMRRDPSYEKQYEAAKKEMRDLSPAMKKLCRTHGYRLEWDTSWMIKSIRIKEQNQDIMRAKVEVSYKNIRLMHEMYLVNKILLGGE